MRNLRGSILCLFAALCLCLTACHHHAPRDPHSDPLVGAWLVKIPEAPFPLHLFLFHADGTVQQANPDAGDPNTSDTNAMGAWRREGDTYVGRIVELTADRSTHLFASRGEITFSIQLRGDSLSGTATANFYDAAGQRIRGPIAATLSGDRIRP